MIETRAFKISLYVKAFLFLIFYSFNLIGSANSANSNVGTSAAQFLKIGVGARPSGMGESFVAVADDANAVYYNPAGLAQLKAVELTAMHSQWFEGLNLDYGAAAIPTSIGTWGISATTLKADGLEKRGETETLQGNFETLDAAYSLSYGKKMGPLSLGATGRYVVQKIDASSAKTFGADVGGLFRFSSRPVRIGFAIKNMGSDIKFNDESDPQPLIVDGGISGLFFKDRFLVSINARKPRDNDVLVGSGIEWTQSLPGQFRLALRGGYNGSYTDAGSANGLSFGAGAGFKQFELDFSWLPLGDLGNTYRYSARLKF